MNARTCLGCAGEGHCIVPATAHYAPGCGIAMETCAACDGTGQVTDRITAQDALCDAETLEWFAVYNAACLNIRHGLDTGRAIEESSGQMRCALGGDNSADDVASYARIGAWGIFRAVPGLRG